MHTLTHALIERYHEEPDARALVFVNEQNEHRSITVREFTHGASAFGRALEQVGIEPGDLIVMVMGHSLSLPYAFYGAMLMGAYPSIFPYPNPRMDMQTYIGNVRNLISRYGIRAVITHPDYYEQLVDILQDVDCTVLSTDDVPFESVEDPDLASFPQAEADDIAFVQHTSGTTGTPKGVALSHEAIINQIDALGVDAFHMKAGRDVLVTWLPFYHDMGLVATLLMPIFLRIPTIMMSPFHWVRDPKIMFQAIDRYGATMVHMPNFAYIHCAKTVRSRDMEGLDLSTIRIMGNGSEPASEEAHQVFFKRFEPYGMTNDVFLVGYGMAENVLAASITHADSRAKVDVISQAGIREGLAEPTTGDDGIEVVSCGPPLKETEIRIVDADFNDLPERTIGRIILRSNCLFDGYYGHPDLTEQVFQDGWYITGDLGYMADGELYPTGREKDIIIVGGHNIYPRELEDIANKTKGVRPGRAVAFGVPDARTGTESVVMICELDDVVAEGDRGSVERDLRARVADQAGIAVKEIHLIDHRWLVKTPSGKIARSVNREKYLEEFAGVRS